MSALYDWVNVERLHQLLITGTDPNEIIIQGETALHFVASRDETNPQDIEDCLQMAHELIACGADVNAETNDGSTPLILAVRARKWRMVELLLEANADVNHADSDSNTALHYAVINHSSLRRNTTLRIVKALLRFHPEMDVKNSCDHTPLIIAVRCHDFHIVRELLRHNASVNFRDSNKCSAMHHALQLEEVNVDIVFELVRHGADFYIRNNAGQTTLDVYIDHLFRSPFDEIKKAKKVFKLYIFDLNPIFPSQRRLIDAISREKNYSLLPYLVECVNEIKKMQRGELATNYYIYDMALRGYSYRFAERSHIPHVIFDKVLDKLLKGQYPIYRDLIVSGICRPYLQNKFVEMCSSVGNTGEALLNFDTILSLSSYLSHVDMLNMMLACSPDSRSVQILECRHRYTNCSIL